MIRISNIPVIMCLFVALAAAVAPACRGAEEGEGEAAPAAVVTGPESPADVAVTTLEEASSKLGEGEALRPISLREAILVSLKNNLDVRVVGFSPQIAATEVGRQLSAFDPVFSGGGSYTSTQTPTFSPVLAGAGFGAVTRSTARSKTSALDLQLSTKATSGGTVSLTWENRKTDTNNVFLSSVSPFYESIVRLGVSQPLLKNAGTAFNRTNIVVAQNNARMSALEFENSVMDLVLDVDIAYWRLVFGIEDLKAKAKSLQAAEDLLKNTIIKVDAGALPRIEVTRARSRVADRQEAIVTAKAAVKSREDGLRALLDASEYDLLSEDVIFPTDRPSVYAANFDLARSVRNALALRPDLRRLAIELENAGILIAWAKNQLLPQVDLQATYAVNGLGTTWHDDYEFMGTFDARDLGAGIVLTVPVGNRLARSAYSAARYRKMQSLARLAASQRNVTRLVKAAIRDVDTALQSIDTNKLRAALAQEQLDAELQKYEVGQSIILDVLDAQDALQQAESDYILSIVGFNAAMFNYYRQTGTILREFSISVSAPASIELEDDSSVIFPYER